jgi:putative DNA primase/helicase
MADHSCDEKIFRIAVSDGEHRGRIKNREASWGKFCARFEKPFRDDVTLAEYMALPKEEQDRRKNHGWYVGGHYRGTKRKAARLIERTIISFDADDLTAEQLDDLCTGLSPLCKFEFVAHSSRKHTPEKPPAPH